MPRMIMHCSQLARSLGLVGMLALATPAADARASGNPDRGMVLFNAYCIGCHGTDGKGDGPVAARLRRDFQVSPTDLSNPAWQRSLNDDALARAISRGGTSVHRSNFMPAWGLTLENHQIADLVAFVRDLRQPRAGQKPSASMLDVQDSLELGRTLYSLYCLACHGSNGVGDGPLVEEAANAMALEHAPPHFDASFFKNRTDAQLAELAQRGPGHAHMGFEADQATWWHRPLSAAELQSLIFYLRALALAKH
jgi:mono/diheme cytochrome c family protein